MELFMASAAGDPVNVARVLKSVDVNSKERRDSIRGGKHDEFSVFSFHTHFSIRLILKHFLKHKMEKPRIHPPKR